MSYNKINNLLAWVCFLISAIVYCFTLEPANSFWDTGEFIAAAYKMQIVHQPGAPLFLMLENVFSNLALGKVEDIAFWMNAGSAISSALTILFLYWTITALARKIIIPSNELSEGKEPDSVNLIKIMGAGVVGALAYAFSDSFWFSAVESEVYAMSSLCTAVVFWAILKWEVRVGKRDADKWLILIAYIMGLSIGIHLLNLLTIPALALVIYFKKTTTPTTMGVIKTLLIGIIVLATILWGIIQYLIKGAAFFDLFFVNTIGAGFGSGIIVFGILVLTALSYGIYYSIKKKNHLLNIVLLSTCFIIMGYSSFTMIVIRAQTNVTLNNNDPDHVFSFLGYLSREQYESEPLFKGPYFNSKPIEIQEGANLYIRGKDHYQVVGKNNSYVYDRETLFPRIYSKREGHAEYYRQWLNLGDNENPTFGDNLNFFYTYQLGNMYFRYFMWNFAGRQNHEQGHGNYTDGNWISGIKFIDNLRLGGQYNLPTSLKTDPSNNKLYFLPLLLGLIGAFWHFKRSQKDASIVGLLFFFTGLAIVLYLNQNPLQPRERDYAYAGSYYAFAIWIGLGVLGISDFLKKKINLKYSVILATGVGFLMAPVLMIKENWDDHDRSDKYLARDLARNYLETCAPNAILFTYSDNETYPLWYVQEVENVRPDVRLINLSLLSADWYVRQLKEKVNQSDALPISMSNDQFAKGTRDFIEYYDYGIEESVELKDVLAVMLSDNSNDKMQRNDGVSVNIFPSKNLQMKIDKANLIDNKAVPEALQEYIVDTMVWKHPDDFVRRDQLVIMDILANNHWKRPIYFASVPPGSLMGLDNYLVREGLASRLMPIEVPEADRINGEIINTDDFYTNLMTKYAWEDLDSVSFLDDVSYGMLSNISYLYENLAEALIKQNKVTEAREVLNRCIEVLPERIYSTRSGIRYSVLSELLYRTGEKEKANKLVKKNMDYLSDLLDYYASISETKPNLEIGNIRFALFALDDMSKSTATYKQDELAKELKLIVDKYLTVFSNL